MTPRRALFVFRLLVLVALGVSSALLVDYLRPTPAFCAAGSGCDQVRKSAGYLFDVVPIPVLGVLAFSTQLLLSLLPRARTFTAWTSVLGAVIAAALIGLQGAVVHAFCSLCVTVDVCAIAAGAFGFLARDATAADDEGLLGTMSWTGLTVLALTLPPAIGKARPAAPVPREVAALWTPGAINVVELSDFECPFCRAAHPALEAAKKTATRPVVTVRKMMPLPRHPQARGAAQAWVCAKQQGKEERMADLLFASEDLSPAVCEGLAEAAGCELPKYRACLADPATDAAIESDIALVKRTDFQGLPTVWIDDVMILGAHDAVDYARAIRDAGTPRSAAAPSWWPVALVIALSGGLFALGLRRRRDDAGDAGDAGTA